MARVCSICTHEKRTEIELSGANGASYRRIAAQFGLAATTVRRHMDGHIKQAAKELHERRDEARTLDVLAQLRAINTVTLAILQKTKDNPKSYELALKSIDRIQRQIEMQAKLLGDLNDGPRIDIHNSEDWINMRELIFTALKDYPEALQAVARAIHEEGQRGRTIA